MTVAERKVENGIVYEAVSDVDAYRKDPWKELGKAATQKQLDWVSKLANIATKRGKADVIREWAAKQKFSPQPSNDLWTQDEVGQTIGYLQELLGINHKPTKKEKEGLQQLMEAFRWKSEACSEDNCENCLEEENCDCACHPSF